MCAVYTFLFIPNLLSGDTRSGCWLLLFVFFSMSRDGLKQKGIIYNIQFSSCPLYVKYDDDEINYAMQLASKKPNALHCMHIPHCVYIFAI